MGETGLQSPEGSLFVISNGPTGQILKPISLGNLAGPTGIAVSSDGMFMYVLFSNKKFCILKSVLCLLLFYLDFAVKYFYCSHLK